MLKVTDEAMKAGSEDGTGGLPAGSPGDGYSPQCLLSFPRQGLWHLV